MIDKIRKRNGAVVEFNESKVVTALYKCFKATGVEKTFEELDIFSKQVVNIISAKYEEPSVEEVQDVVEMVLQAAGEYEAAKKYILYRAEKTKLRENRPIPEEVKEAFERSSIYFKQPSQQFQFYDKYSRFNYELGRRETWEETVERAVNFLKYLSKNKLDVSVYDRLKYSILNMNVMPSMRLLAMAGPAAERNNISIFNCSFMGVDSIDSFVEALVISMSGCGVGFSVERQFVDELPKIKRQPKKGHKEIPTHIIDDSTEGWADSIKIGLNAWFNGKDVNFDFSQIRPAGAILKTKGGRASGPLPLKEMLSFLREKILQRQGGTLKPVDAHDMMCEIGNAAVQGGTRRTAMISLFDFDDMEMRNAKIGNFPPRRWNANNSAVIDRKLSQQEIMELMLTMFKGGTGEPGIFSRYAVENTLPKDREYRDTLGTNPSLRAGTLIWTREFGIMPIENLQDKEFTVTTANNEQALAKCFLSGKNKRLHKITLDNNVQYFGTAEHKWPIVKDTKTGEFEKVTTLKLKAGNYLPVIKRNSLNFGNFGDFNSGFLAGWLFGDGSVTRRTDNNRLQIGLTLNNKNFKYDRKIVESLYSSLRKLKSDAEFKERTRTETNFPWYELATQNKNIEQWLETIRYDITKNSIPKILFTEASEEFRRGFISALFSADGSIDTYNSNPSIILTSKNKNALKELSNLLGFYGIISRIYNRKPTQGNFPNGKNYNKTYKSYVLKISSQDSVSHFNKIFDLFDLSKKEKLSQCKVVDNPLNFIKIKEIHETDLIEDVWDITVYDSSHTFQLSHAMTGNCGEIILRPKEFCNLSIAVARVDDTLETLKEKVELATIIGTIQSMATDFKLLRPEWKENCDEERLLGVDITGQMDCPLVQDSEVLKELKEVSIKINEEYAEKLEINKSASVTCVNVLRSLNPVNCWDILRDNQQPSLIAV